MRWHIPVNSACLRIPRINNYAQNALNIHNKRVIGQGEQIRGQIRDLTLGQRFSLMSERWMADLALAASRQISIVLYVRVLRTARLVPANILRWWVVDPKAIFKFHSLIYRFRYCFLKPAHLCVGSYEKARFFKQKYFINFKISPELEPDENFSY